MRGPELASTDTLQSPLPFLLMAVASAVLMATIGIVSRVTGLAAETITFYRLFFGTVLMLLFLWSSGKLHLIRCRPSLQLALSGSMLGGFIVCYVQAMQYISMASAIMMIYLAPVVAAIGAHWLLHERLRLINLLLIALALGGFALMMGSDLSFSGGEQTLLGIGFGLLSTLAYAAFILLNRRQPAGQHAFTNTFYQLLFGALSVLPFAFLAGDHISTEQWPWLLGAGFLPGFLAILLAVSALQKLPASTFGTLAYMEPIAVILFGWSLFGESLSLQQLFGCGLIIGSGLLQGWSTSANGRFNHLPFARQITRRQKG